MPKIGRKIGRNDACPCGSGRKYKRCCMGHEEEREAIAATIDRTALPLLSEVARSTERYAPRPDSIAREFFPFWRGPLDDAKAARLMDFEIFDFVLPGLGRRGVEQFMAERGERLTDAERAMVDEWSAAAFRLYVVESWSGGFVRCNDALAEDGAVIDVLPLRGRGPIGEGSPIALRALASSGGAFFCTTSPLQFGDRSSTDVIEAIRARHLDFVRRRKIVGIEDFLRVAPTALDEEAAIGASMGRIIVPSRLS